MASVSTPRDAEGDIGEDAEDLFPIDPPAPHPRFQWICPGEREARELMNTCGGSKLRSLASEKDTPAKRVCV